MDDSPFAGMGLRPIELADQAMISALFSSLNNPISDYTFAQLFTWRNSLRIYWKLIHGHLCVFANGTGDLTLLMPPIGDGGSAADAALRESFDVMDVYNRAHGVEHRSRVEYVSEELLGRFDRAKLSVRPLGNDYVYRVERMIELTGGDLASKRQARNRFLRNYVHRVEDYDPARHRQACVALLNQWTAFQDVQHSGDPSTAAVKRHKEALSCELALAHARELGLRGIVVWVQDAPGGGNAADDGWRMRGFTFGEALGRDQSSIVIEKTDLQVKGLAQFIFSEFCRRHWADRPLVNVGDDWGLESLAWTKMSYRPIKLLNKYVIGRAVAARVDVPAAFQGSCSAAPAVVRVARKDDVSAAVDLERSCFSAYCLTKRQFLYLQKRPSAVILVAEQGGRIVGEGVGLVRQHQRGRTGRIYSLAVDGASRRQNIGGRLLEAMLSNLTARGVERVYLEVEQDNAPAVRMYQHRGFRPVGRLSDYYGPGRDGLHMVYDAAPQANAPAR